LFVCMSCLSVWSHGSPSLFPSSFLSFSFLSLYFFLFLSLSLSFFISFPLFFFEQARSNAFLKQRYSFGCLELCNEALTDFLHTLTFVCKSSVQCRGLLSSVFQLQRASKCSADVDLIFLGIVCPLFFLIVT